MTAGPIAFRGYHDLRQLDAPGTRTLPGLTHTNTSQYEAYLVLGEGLRILLSAKGGLMIFLRYLATGGRCRFLDGYSNDLATTQEKLRVYSPEYLFFQMEEP